MHSDKLTGMVAQLLGAEAVYVGESYHVTESDRLHNASLVHSAQTRFRKGQTVLYRGHRVRITVVLPAGFISWSASKSAMTGRKLPAVVCDQTLYRFEAVKPHLGGSASGQAPEDAFSELPEECTA